MTRLPENEHAEDVPEEIFDEKIEMETGAAAEAETDTELETDTETEPECAVGSKPRTFGHGVAVGILATLGCAVIFSSGWQIARRYLARQQAENATQQQGAEVLTDDSTLEKLVEVQQIIEQNYLEEVDSELLQTYMMKGVAVGLDDPYANYYSAEELQSVLDSSYGEYFGIGVTLSVDRETGVICAAQVYEGSPADLAGMQVDDIVRALDGETVVGMELSDLVALIKGKKEPFVLTVYRPDLEQELDLTMECDTVEINHVEYRMLEDGIGYIQILEFAQNAVDQFEDAVEALQEAGMEKLVVDVRGNPGGLLTSVCDIADMFLSNDLIVYTEDRDGKCEEYYADDDQLVTCETAVLVDGYSASAAEIFAGVIQDYGLGPVVGTQTYGKGVVQITYPLSDGSAFKLTVQKYFTPKGQDIDGNGIMPDIIIEEDEEAQDVGITGTQIEQDEQESESQNGQESESQDEQESESQNGKNTGTQIEPETAQTESEMPDSTVQRAVEVLRNGWENPVASEQ